MLRSATLSICLACGALVLACSNDPTSVRSPADPAPTFHTALQQVGKQAFSELALKRGLALPITQGHLSDPYLVDAPAGIINPGDYVCEIDSPVLDFANAERNESLANDSAEVFRLGSEFLADQVPFLEARFFLTEDTPQSFGYDGEFTDVLQKTERDVKRFWDISSDDIQLLALKGTMLQDEERTAFVYQNFFSNDDGSPISAEQATAIADTVRTLLLQAETLDGGNDPAFSFNAFAFSTNSAPSPRIVMGDGFLEGFKAVGLADVAPQGLYAHEFAHHISAAHNYAADPIPGATPPVARAERTRYIELGADAMAAYYLTHKRGAALNKHRVAQFLSVFFQIGDCAFTDLGHHGTPVQRMRAAQFGFDVADQAQTQGHILTSDQFHDLFVAAYPNLVAPDAT